MNITDHFKYGLGLLEGLWRPKKQFDALLEDKKREETKQARKTDANLPYSFLWCISSPSVINMRISCFIFVSQQYAQVKRRAVKREQKAKAVRLSPALRNRFWGRWGPSRIWTESLKLSSQYCGIAIHHLCKYLWCAHPGQVSVFSVLIIKHGLRSIHGLKWQETTLISQL